MFYAARAAVRDAGSDAGTHRGVASEFSRLVVRDGRTTPEVGRLLRSLLASRLEADYDDGEHLVQPEVALLLADAARFVNAVEGGEEAQPGTMPVWTDLTPDQKRDLVAQLTREMKAASETLEFEKSAELRDSVTQIEASLVA